MRDPSITNITFEQFLKTVQSRRSIRKFLERQVERDRIDMLMEAARWAPSNHNRQPWKFLVIDDKQTIHALAESIQNELSVEIAKLPDLAAGFGQELIQHATFFANAPVLIVAWHKQPVRLAGQLLANLKNSDLISGEPLSTAMAVQNLLLAASVTGLGACVMTAPLLAFKSLNRLLATPPGFEVNCFIAVGFADTVPAPPNRKDIKHIYHYWENSNT